ncbi:SDR family oxidoreductase [Asticcacaulis sp. EMRT-3]|uniref:SDR family oxidoreductase n=1 Tax=Asticcacaulis sp. EMRT-3 TaxID=3040349 RepID=UPI0024AEA504|nr:SDR family oxidoreductase [Asticcacaulis sp. EMRT-3]MDI7775759.1 SDR family oxidoreductase [Asticcacaulis sp. EMRT-3]
MFNFSGKVVLITGAAGGIGQGLCEAFLGWNATVLAFDRAAETLDGMDARLHKATPDLTDLEAVKAAVAALTAKTGPVDILINNAGAAAAVSLSTLTPDDWAHDLAINLSAAYHCVEATKAAMFARGSGVVINIGTVNAMLAIGHPAYSAAKAGLVSYTKALAVEYGPRGLRANLVAPGTVKTQAWNARAAQKPEVFDDLKKWYPLRDFATPQDIANAVAFLASDLGRMITGVVLPVDAGLTAGNPVLASELTLEQF